MKHIDAVCENLENFLRWAYSDCHTEGEHKISRLRMRCKNIFRIKNEISGFTARSLDKNTKNDEIIRNNIKKYASSSRGRGRYTAKKV